MTCGLRFSLEKEQKSSRWSLGGNVFQGEGNSTEKGSRLLRGWHLEGLKEKKGLDWALRSGGVRNEAEETVNQLSGQEGPMLCTLHSLSHIRYFI